MNTNHGFTIVASVKLDEHGHSYFGAGLWTEISKYYVLKASTKIALHLKEPYHTINANFPDDILRTCYVGNKCSL